MAVDPCRALGALPSKNILFRRVLVQIVVQFSPTVATAAALHGDARSHCTSLHWNNCTGTIVRDIRPSLPQTHPKPTPSAKLFPHTNPPRLHPRQQHFTTTLPRQQTPTIPNNLQSHQPSAQGHNFTVRSVPLSPHRQPTLTAPHALSEQPTRSRREHQGRPPPTTNPPTSNGGTTTTVQHNHPTPLPEKCKQPPRRRPARHAPAHARHPPLAPLYGLRACVADVLRSTLIHGGVALLSPGGGLDHSCRQWTFAAPPLYDVDNRPDLGAAGGDGAAGICGDGDGAHAERGYAVGEAGSEGGGGADAECDFGFGAGGGGEVG
ncbi:hypothetical protein V502_03251 [Pseudogymnoascus sp. VKM F-4520 (FW-2644)]|nr:hypothetical protein V502_03251 [Pseudogymnoascus sp. VKM F-4520 (FW-2644)]